MIPDPSTRGFVTSVGGAHVGRVRMFLSPRLRRRAQTAGETMASVKGRLKVEKRGVVTLQTQGTTGFALFLRRSFVAGTK